MRNSEYGSVRTSHILQELAAIHLAHGEGMHLIQLLLSRYSGIHINQRTLVFVDVVTACFSDSLAVSPITERTLLPDTYFSIEIEEVVKVEPLSEIIYMYILQRKSLSPRICLSLPHM